MRRRVLALPQKERAPITGVIELLLFDGPIGTNPIQHIRHNLVTDNMRNGMVRRLLGTSATATEGKLYRLAFGTSPIAPAVGDSYLALELQRMLINPGEAIQSGTHYLASVPVGYNDLITAKTTITTITDATHIIVPSTTGFRVGDYLEVNPVDTSNITTNAQNVTISAIPDGTHITLSGSGLNLAAPVPPAVGWFVMQLVHEAGAIQDATDTTVATAASNTSFTLTSATGFAIGQQIRVQMGLTNMSYEVVTIQNLVGVTVTLQAPGLSTTPVVGRTVDNGILANHATGFFFRKTAAQTALANLDISFN